MTMNHPPPPAPLLSESDARAILDPHMDDLRACLRAGWDVWVRFGDELPDIRINTSNRARAALVYDAMAAEARRRFSGKPGVNVQTRHGFVVVTVESVLVLRFKKYRNGFKTSNVPTLQQRLFSLQGPIDGMPDAATKAVVGYYLDRLQEDFAAMAVTCRYDSALLWLIEIPEALSAAAPTPIPVVPDQDIPPAPRVTPQQPAEEADETKTI